MWPKLKGALLMPALIFVAPLLFRPERLLHPAPWIGVLAALCILVSQPPLGLDQMLRDARDRRSGLAIFAGMIAPQVTAVLEFALRASLRPATTSAWVIAGFLVAASGIVLRIWAIRTLGKYFTSVVRADKTQSVISSGPYALLRHPSYTAAMLIALGVVLSFASIAGLILICLATAPAYLYRIRVEERALLAETAGAYADYKSRTWGLVPYVY